MVARDPNGSSLSPRDLARVLGVSESSLKRWIDAGRLPAMRTSGGHRRVELLTALRFLRETGRPLVDPAPLGLPGSADRLSDPDATGERVFELLRAGEADGLTRVLLAALVTRAMEPAQLCDGPLRSAMERIGMLWNGDRSGIFVEHRATQALLHALDQVAGLFPTPSDARVAVGGSAAHDPSLLPTRMASVVLAAQGLRSIDLGADTPLDVLLEASEALGAELVWVSIGTLVDVERQRADLVSLAGQLAQRGVELVLGGREIDRLHLPPELRGLVGRDMQDLAARASSL